MIRFALRTLFSAFVLAYVLPVIPGVHFYGSFFPDAVVYGVLFAVVSWVVNWLLKFAAVAFTLATFGIGAVFAVLAYIVGWWLIPAIQLEALAAWFPHHMHIDSFGSAILAGLLWLVINAVLLERPKKKS